VILNKADFFLKIKSVLFYVDRLEAYRKKRPRVWFPVA
jgi:hypothetical protein